MRLTGAERRALEVGRRREERGDAAGAIEAYEQLLATRGFADVHYRVGTLLDEQGDAEQATRHLERALALNPDYLEALLALVGLYERHGDFQRGAALAARAQERAQAEGGRLDATTQAKLANLQAELGDAFRDAGELREAIDAYRKALDRCPQFLDVRQRLGIALREAGRPDAAIAELRRVIDANPSYREARVQLGVTLYSLGRAPEAVEQWQQVLREEPEREDARMYLRLVASPRPPERA